MIDPKQVHEVIARHQLADGMRHVVDLDGSHGCWLRDARTGDDYLDAYTCFASWPIGYNHPAMREPEFQAELLRAASTNISNSDLYTREMAAFVDAFATRATPPGYPHHFWIAGGTLAVENTLKTAFDWKARKLGRTALAEDVNDLVVLHFRQAFHGRSGYGLSLTNTVPDKIGLFPKFPWPRVHNPAIAFDLDGGIANDVEAEERRSCAEIEAAFERHGKRIAAILIEPMQGEGGDNHFRPQFLQRLRQYADAHEAMLIFDEVQTGFFGSGTAWLWQQLDVAPDLVAFGKKTQICGFYGNRRVDEVADNVFVRPSRINSTWGGNLVDMVRCRRFLDIIDREQLAQNARARGQQVVDGLRGVARRTGKLANVRGVGTLVAFTLPTAEARNQALQGLAKQKVLALASGPASIRFRLPMVLSAAEADELVARTQKALAG